VAGQRALPLFNFKSEGFSQPQKVNKRYVTDNGRVIKRKQEMIARQHAPPVGPTVLYARAGCVNVRSISSVNLESVLRCGLRSFRAA